MNDLMTKSFLSYVELKKQTQIDTKSEEPDIEKGIQEHKIIITPSDESNLTNFFQEVDAIKSTMEEITNLLSDLQTLNQETKSTHSPKVLRGLRDRMESDMVSVLRKANLVRTRLESLHNSNESNRTRYKKDSAVDRTRVSVTNGLRVKLKETMNDFQDLRNKIVADHKEYLKKRYFNEIGEYPDEKTIELMVSGSGKVFEGKKDLILENKERHEAVMDIKNSLNKLHQVFLDMAVLVETQGLNLDDIEGNVAKAGSFVSGGTDSLFYAKQMKDKQSKKWVCFVFSVIIIICLVCFIAMLSSF